MSHLRLVPPYVEPAAVPWWERELAWLALSCGGTDALAGLDDRSLTDDGLDLPEEGRLAAVGELLDDVADRWHDTETRWALRRAALRVWETDHALLTRAHTAAPPAGAICWAVGRANGWFGPRQRMRVADVAHVLATSSSLGSQGARVRTLLLGAAHDDDPTDPLRPWAPPLLLPLGHPDLLVSATRRQLVRRRDRALAAAAASDHDGVFRER